MTTRFGPLSAIGGEVPALAVGDVDMRHARFTVAGVAWHRGDTRRVFVPWADIESVSIDPPKTWWPHPLIGDWIVPVFEGFLGAGSDLHEPAPYFARVTVRGEDETLWELDRHHVSGYRRGDARATARLVDHLSATPASRGLLGQPDEVIGRVSSVLRTVR